MTAAILGRKIGMTRVFDKDGATISVTVIQAGPCPILQVRTQKTDGYDAIQLGFDKSKAGRSTMPAIGHAAKAGTTPQRFVREVRLASAAEAKPGDLVTVESFESAGVNYVDIVGTTIGKGFQGVMRR